jgi:succinyl-diaminopimelate desuccinylase
MSVLDEHLERQQSESVEFLKSLVRIATVNPPGERYAECVGVLEQRLQTLGLSTRVVRVPDEVVAQTLPDSAGYPRYNLIGRWEVGAVKTLHFNAHYDVVPISGQWKHGDAFKPEVEDGWMYGRGSEDMKASIAAVCAALQAVRDANATPKVNIEVSFTADEEVGGELGAGYIVRQGMVKPDFAIECEGGERGEIGYGHNGVLWFRVRIDGKPAHAARPHTGVNAFEGAANIVNQMQGLKKRLARRTFKPVGGKLMQPTINIGGVFGVGSGAKVNTVPAQAWFTIDRRIVPNEKLASAEREVIAALRAARAKTPRIKMDVGVFQRIDPCVSDVNSAFHRQFAQVVRSVRRRNPKFTVVRGFTDLHWFSTDLGVPGIGYGPHGEHAHGVDERVDTADLLAVAKVYARFMESFDPSES